MEIDIVDEVARRAKALPKCSHDRLMWYQTGGISAVQGEYHDDITDCFYCQDCGADLSKCHVKHGEKLVTVEIRSIDPDRRKALIHAIDGHEWKFGGYYGGASSNCRTVYWSSLIPL
jgi:hypothetical protein